MDTPNDTNCSAGTSDVADMSPTRGEAPYPAHMLIESPHKPGAKRINTDPFPQTGIPWPGNETEMGGGLVNVMSRDGPTGIFRFNGRWVEGDLRDANNNLLLLTGRP